MVDEIILFDIPSKPPRKTWSFNPWRTRLLLGYKGLKYRTEWLEYPEIRTRLQEHVPDDGSDTPYTIPTILFPDGTYVMHSRRILDAINERYPSPPLRYDTPQLPKLWENLELLMVAFEGVYIPGVAKRILGPGSLEYFHRTREEDLGMSLDELEAKRGEMDAYERIEPFLRKITEQLGENEGPFFEGKEVNHVDFVWVGILLFMKTLGGDVFEEVMKRCGDVKRHEELLEAVRPWAGRVD